MPIVNGKYESPIWENNHQPAMDAAEMQAITDSVEESIHALGDYTTPAQKMGLTGDLSVGASLGVLADIGNVHVWRKTVAAEEEVPAGYELGNAIQITLVQNPYGSGHSNAEYYISSNVTVSENGEISLVSPETIEIWNGPDYISSAEPILGKFIKFTGTLNGNEVSSGISSDDVYFIPVDAEIITNTEDRPSYTNVSGAKRVSGYPATPPGTHVTYLTSTNRNAYQEGTDGSEKPAGYTVGETRKNEIILKNVSSSYQFSANTSPNISILDDGTPVFRDGGSGGYVEDINGVIANDGAFIYIEKIISSSGGSNLLSEPWLVKSVGGRSSLRFNTNTGSIECTGSFAHITTYPAIPAGTTIEYLGVLGDKPRMQVVSYVGTGTYGDDNPNTITFDFAPKIVFIFRVNGNHGVSLNTNWCESGVWIVGANGFMVRGGTGGSSDATNCYNSVSVADSTFSWDNNQNESNQLNSKSGKYMAISFG